MKSAINVLLVSFASLALVNCASLDADRQLASDCNPHHVHMNNDHTGHHHFGSGDANSSAYSGQNMDRIHDQAEGNDC